MTVRYFRVATFASSPFQGSPALVFPLSRWLPEAVMKSLAAETQQRSCIFFILPSTFSSSTSTSTPTSPSSPSSSSTDPCCLSLRARWFTPGSELAVCGHASLAAAHVFWQLIAPAAPPVRALRFKSAAGGETRLTVQRAAEPAKGLSAVLPAVQLFPLTDGLEHIGLREILGECGEYRVFCASVPKLYVALAKQQAVERLAPRMELIEALKAYSGIVVTAPGTSSDYVLRYFCPKNGYDEDYTTVSAHATLTPYWSKLLKKTSLSALQLSARRCLVSTEYCPQDERVTVQGHCTLTGQGSFYIPL